MKSNVKVHEVNEAPAITSAANATFTTGINSSFTVTTSGLPTPSLTLGGAPLVPATLAAVGIRLATLWLATVMGMGAFGWLEARRRAG